MIDLGRLRYRPAYDLQQQHLAEVLAAREAGGSDGSRILVVEHDPVVTVTKRAAEAGHVLADDAMLARLGIERVETDRGGDVTYHGPGQLVCYPILDLKRFGFRVHDYMRFLEQVVIDTLAVWGVEGQRDESATGVWVQTSGGQFAKVCAMGVRIRRWISMHGLALNVTTDLSHFDQIVPCGLAGRPVTSLEQLMDVNQPTFGEVRDRLTNNMRAALAERVESV